MIRERGSIKNIIFVVIGMILLSVLLFSILPLLTSVTCKGYIKEIDNLKNRIRDLENQISEKDKEILRLSSLLSFYNISNYFARTQNDHE